MADLVQDLSGYAGGFKPKIGGVTKEFNNNYEDFNKRIVAETEEMDFSDIVSSGVDNLGESVNKIGCAVVNNFKSVIADSKEFFGTANDRLTATALPAIEAANSKINTFITRTSTTIATAGLSLAEGVGKPGEALVDVGAIVVTAIASLPTLLIDAGSDIYFKLIGNDLDSLTNKMLEATKSFVATSIRKVQNNPLFFRIAKLGLYYKQCW